MRTPTIEGALALDLENATSEVTIFVDAPELWDSINLDKCPLAVGEAVSISGCVNGPPFQVADCVDLDLALVDEGGTRLRMGEAGTDRCAVRPDTVGETAFTRSDG